MKLNFVILLTSLLVISASCKKITYNQIEGTWTFVEMSGYANPSDEPNFRTIEPPAVIIFLRLYIEETITFTDKNEFYVNNNHKQGTYNLERKKIIFETTDKTYDSDIVSASKDELYIKVYESDGKVVHYKLKK